MKEKFLQLTPELYGYLTQQRTHSPLSPLLDELRAETLRLGDPSRMMISREQGSFLSLLVGLTGTRNAIEIGTFTGYSSLCIANALPKDGSLLCCDIDVEWTSIARKYWQRANVDSRIRLVIASAIDTVRSQPLNELWDFAFIDADKTSYDAYYEAILPRLRPNGLILFDNMLWGGRVIEPAMASDDPDTRAIVELNTKLSHDPRIESVLLPVADGIHICRKK
jgi:caffeoyl-CoA O-methyltransferase